MSRRLLMLGMGVAVLVVTSAPARADSATPTNYRSVVEDIEPATSKVDARVVGGDSFLEVEAMPGTEVVVFGYEQEPYLRFESDGRVFVNRNSPAFFINDDRFGQVAIPASATPDAAPDWLQVGTEGRYGWHDHRIHWMAPAPPPGVAEDTLTVIQEWTVPLEVDGRPVVVAGRLSWVPTTSPIPSLAVGLVTLASMLAVKRRPAFVVPVAVILSSAAGLLVGIAQAATSPLGFAGEVLAWITPALSLIAGVMAFVKARWNLVPGVGGASLMVIWSLQRITSLWMPVLPTELPTGLERTAVAIAAFAASIGLITAFGFVGGAERE